MKDVHLGAKLGSCVSCLAFAAALSVAPGGSALAEPKTNLLHQ